MAFTLRVIAAGALVLAICSESSALELYEARCGGCHSVQLDRVGPRHFGVANRQAGSVKGFTYSEALVKAGASQGLRWTRASLDQWLSNPEALVPGQAMGYSLSNAEERRMIIDYLLGLN
jgi:cytochrome c